MKEKEFIESIVEKIDLFMADSKVEKPLEKSRFIQKVVDALVARQEPERDYDCIKAPHVVLEVVDETMGTLFRRYLEIDYLENSNGLQLTGETMNGEESHISFLSEQAINRLYELKGSEWDEPRCK